jgi:hypothetical protein
MKKPIRGYTIVGFYEDNGQIWVEHVQGHDVNEAVVKAVKKLANLDAADTDMTQDTKSFRQNVCIVEVFCGTHKGQTEDGTVSAAIDWPGLEVE